MKAAIADPKSSKIRFKKYKNDYILPMLKQKIKTLCGVNPVG